MWFVNTINLVYGVFLEDYFTGTRYKLDKNNNVLKTNYMLQDR